MQKLAATLRANLPTLLQAQRRLGSQLRGDIESVVNAGKRLQGNPGGAGNEAIACVSAAGSGLVSASASVSAKAGASTSAR